MRKPSSEKSQTPWFALQHGIPFSAAALFSFLILAPGTADARPQDEVMSGAFRCGAIGDLRLWLDCYYGAAQPVRASLGMPAASAPQLALVATPPAGTIPPADVALRDETLKTALACNAAAAGRNWLDCFYAAAEPVRGRLGLKSSGSKTQTAAAPPSNFGLRPLPEKQPDRVAARMAKYEFNRAHLFTVTLDNGQVWQQIEGDDRYARWDKRASSYAVVISRGMFGSYNLQVVKQGSVYKVRRAS